MKTRKRRGPLWGEGLAWRVGLTVFAALPADTEGRAAAEPRWTRYDPSLFRFLRHNEVLLPVESIGNF